MAAETSPIPNPEPTQEQKLATYMKYFGLAENDRLDVIVVAARGVLFQTFTPDAGVQNFRIVQERDANNVARRYLVQEHMETADVYEETESGDQKLVERRVYRREIARFEPFGNIQPKIRIERDDSGTITAATVLEPISDTEYREHPIAGKYGRLMSAPYDIPELNGFVGGQDMRVAAAAEAYKVLSQKFPGLKVITTGNDRTYIDTEGNDITAAEMQKRELVFQGIPQEAIIERPDSDNSFKELYNLVDYLYYDNVSADTAIVIHNEYQTERIVRMHNMLLVYAKIQRPNDHALHKAIAETHYLNEITITSAESVLAYVDPEFRILYDASMSTDEGYRTLLAEQKGQKDLVALRYGVPTSSNVEITVQPISPSAH